MFYRRIYYDKLTGEILDSRMAFGAIRILPITEELLTYSTLSGYNRATAGVMEWMERDEAVEAKFNAQRLARIDVSKTPPEMVFEDFPPEGEEHGETD